MAPRTHWRITAFITIGWNRSVDVGLGEYVTHDFGGLARGLAHGDARRLERVLLVLGGALASGDTAKAFEAAHTLKGVTGNMGLTPLYAALCTLVEPLRTGERRDDYPMLFQAVQTEFRRADELRAALKGEGRT